MAFLVCERDGSEYIYHHRPDRIDDAYFDGEYPIRLPKGSIARLIGRELTWDDEPYRLDEIPADKRKGTVKYYFVSYRGTDRSDLFKNNSKLGHCLIEANNISLDSIVRRIEDERNLKWVTITHLNSLREEEYRMLKGQ